MTWGRSRVAAGVVAALSLVFASCANGGPEPDPAIGFIFVGATDDLGYNQAASEGADALARRYPDLRVLRERNIPETEAAGDAMERLIAQGARLIFATSFGYLGEAYRIASEHPEVIVIHQGGIEPTPLLPNFGTIWASVVEAVYQTGVAAGGSTRSGRLGFVGAFKIPPVLANINAFTLGARSVRPDATVDVRFTDGWCDPAAQRTAIRELLALDVDVLAQHQDCTREGLEAARDAEIGAVGLHADGSEVAGDAWLIGAVWNWAPTYIDIVATWQRGSFVGSPFDGDFRPAADADLSPFILTVPGPNVDAATRAALGAARSRFARGGSPFEGPLRASDGSTVVPAGQRLSQEQVESIDFLVEGARDR